MITDALTTALLVLCCALAFAAAPGGGGRLSRRWLFVMRDLTNPDNLERTLALLPRAKAAGCNGIILSDRGLQRLGDLDTSVHDHYRKFQVAVKSSGMELIPTVMSIGYGGSILRHNPNLAEGLPVRDALFVAQNGVARHLPNPDIGLRGGDFSRVEGDRFLDWDGQDYVGGCIFADHEVFRTKPPSVRMQDFPAAKEDDPQARLWQKVKVQPFRQYRLSVWARSEEIRTPSEVLTVSVRTAKAPVMALNFSSFPFSNSGEWEQFHVVFNSLDNEELMVYLGAWGNEGGRVWWDDMELVEIGLVNVLRREGCPLTVRGENGTAYVEGRDFDPVHDPNLRPSEVYHEPPVIRLTKDTRIGGGERLLVSYYHPVVVWAHQVVNCLSDPMIFDLLRDEVRRVNDLLHPEAFFMQHDEIRVANWDQVCEEKGLTPGGLLAENMRQCVKIIRDLRPDARMWVWSDMWDPVHNAAPGFPERWGAFYLVNGSFRGSWEGLPSEVGIVNWGGVHHVQNLKWFSGRGHEQVLAGYYDGDKDGSGIAGWLAAARGVPGVTGAAYTTWRDDFSALEAWAEKAWGGGK
jgi:hypothetical protein